MKEIKESQQASQGINIGNSGNHGGATPEGAKGTHHKQNTKDIFPARRDHQQKAENKKRSKLTVDKFKFLSAKCFI